MICRVCSKKNSRGFTLPELLIAAMIFAFAASGILAMFINCAFLDQANRNKSIAAIHAEFIIEDIMEYMRLNLNANPLTFLQEKIDPALGGKGDWDLDSGTTVKIGDYFGCTFPVYPCVLNNESISTTYDPLGTDPLEITVEVSWQDGAKTKTRYLELKTYISKR